MYQRTITTLLLGALCLLVGGALAGCVLVDDFSQVDETTSADPKALIEAQLPSHWAAIITNPSVPDAGFVYGVEFREGGTQTLDVGVAEFEGTWVITEDHQVELKYSGAADQDDIVADVMITDDIVTSLSVELEVDSDGGKKLLTFRRADRAHVSATDLHGDWRTQPLDQNQTRLGTEFDAVSFYGVYTPVKKERYLEGELRTFPCGTARSCWALANAKFADGVKSDDGTDISGRPAPQVGGTIRLEDGEPSGIYLPLVDEDGVKNQVLAVPPLL